MADDTETAMLKAVRDRIRSALSYTNQQCGVQIGPQPPPMSGDLYAAVHPEGWVPDIGNEGVSESISVGVTVTIRVPPVPKDRTGDNAFILASSGLNARLWDIIQKVHRSYDVMAAADAFLPAAREKFFTPLRFGSMDAAPRAVDGSWFSARSVDSRAGLVRTVHFVDARREQDSGAFS